MEKKSRRGKRRRGVRLSAQGGERLKIAEAQQAAKDNDRYPYTLEALTEITGLSINTLTKVRSGKTPVDRQTIAAYFEAFGLTPMAEDYAHPDAVVDDALRSDPEDAMAKPSRSRSVSTGNREGAGSAIAPVAGLP